MNSAERIKTIFLNTLIMESECFNRLKKFILDGPKYLLPLIEGTEVKSFSIFLKDPEKLFYVAFSLIIFSTVDLGKQVKFPYLIDLPVNVSVINLLM